jgi:hypothetical protein
VSFGTYTTGFLIVRPEHESLSQQPKCVGLRTFGFHLRLLLNLMELLLQLTDGREGAVSQIR